MTEREIRSWLMDMDGVLVREEQAIPGADRFIARLRELGTPFMVLTNNSMYTRRDLAARLAASGIDVPEEAIWTSALATAGFLESQRPEGTAFVIGEAGLTTALHASGYTLTERAPDYVVLGETRTYSFERISRAIRLIVAGARFIATNPDPTGPTSDGPGAGDRLGGGVDQPRDGGRALLRRQAEPADDALRAECDRRALGDGRHGRRPDGHGRRLRAGGRHGDGARADRRDDPRGGRALPLPRLAHRRLRCRPAGVATMRRCTSDSEVSELTPNDLPVPEELSRRRLRSRLLFAFGLVAAVVAAVTLLPGLGGLRSLLAHAKPEWVLLGVPLKLLSGVGYVAVFRMVFCRRMSWRVSYQIGMSELGANALFPTGGAGGLALGAWALRRGGMQPSEIARRTVAFFLLTSVPNVLGVIIIGVGLAAGLFGGESNLLLTALPAAVAALAIVGDPHGRAHRPAVALEPRARRPPRGLAPEALRVARTERRRRRRR